MTEENFPYEPFDVSDYVKSTFHMYTGNEDWIKIRFHNELVNVIIDKFGKEVEMKQDGEDCFIVSTKAKVSEGLRARVLSLGRKAQVLSPAHLVEDVRTEIQLMQQLYN